MISLCSLCPLWLTIFIHLKTGVDSETALIYKCIYQH
jgi:hypothetical protein